MSQIEERFRALREEKRNGFIPFLIAGDPDLTMTARLLDALSGLEPAAIKSAFPSAIRPPTDRSSSVRRNVRFATARPWRKFWKC